MAEDSNSRIKEWAITSLKSVLSLSHEIFEGVASDVSSSSLLLRHLFYFLKNAGWTQTTKPHHFQKICCFSLFFTQVAIMFEYVFSCGCNARVLNSLRPILR
jgi:hypothetical protein